MSVKPFGTKEFQAKIATFWPGQDRPDGTMETIKVLYDEVGEEIADAIEWYIESTSKYEGVNTDIEYNMKSPQNFLAMKQLVLKSYGAKWAAWMSRIIMDDYNIHLDDMQLGRAAENDMQA